ncbi:hypothetical protein GJ20_gp47 [Lactococcus phage P092]|uniref:Uncharacterized protein n=1 Tax=Lactococcus phage P092 TaxID=1476887 RepID=X4YUK1_9CAUD|nr:hypothetical protein GJ20_gp47 [Lactococcus phage P092]AHV83088.1 hypothetical protein P092_0047 [Lactococcus phage P092]
MIYFLLIIIAAMAIYIVNIQVSFYQYKKRIDDCIKTARNDVNILREILSVDYDTEVIIHHYINDKTTVEKIRRTGQK